MLLIVNTQDYENYGYRWKLKPGSEYRVINVPEHLDAKIVLDQVRDQIEVDNELYKTHIISYNLEPDNYYLSSFETWQLEDAGRIDYPEPVIDYKLLHTTHI